MDIKQGNGTALLENYWQTSKTKCGKYSPVPPPRSSWTWLTKSKREFVSEYKKSDLLRTLEINLNSETIGILPPPLINIYKSIIESKYILELENNWDDEGSPPYKKSTWKTAIKFLITLSNLAYDKIGVIIDAPRIYHSSEGSIDLLWKKDHYRLLINIPEDQDSLATFYGDDYESQKIEGAFDPNKNNLNGGEKNYYTKNKKGSPYDNFFRPFCRIN